MAVARKDYVDAVKLSGPLASEEEAKGSQACCLPSTRERTSDDRLRSPASFTIALRRSYSSSVRRKMIALVIDLLLVDIESGPCSVARHCRKTLGAIPQPRATSFSGTPSVKRRTAPSLNCWSNFRLLSFRRKAAGPKARISARHARTTGGATPHVRATCFNGVPSSTRRTASSLNSFVSLRLNTHPEPSQQQRPFAQGYTNRATATSCGCNTYRAIAALPHRPCFAP